MTNTKQTILDLMSRAACALDPKQVTATVADDSKRYSRPRYLLDMNDNNGMYTSAPVILDTDEAGDLTLWVRPRASSTEQKYSASSVVLEQVQDIFDELRAIQREQGQPNGRPCAPGFDTYVLSA